jgi:RNA-directed DNA polymerase
MNIALHGMEAVATEGAANGRDREQPLLVRYADDFVILHSDLKELQKAVRRVKHWLARMELHLHADKTRITHTLTPYQGQVGFDFLGFNIRQERATKAGVKTIIAPCQEANKRHLATIEQRLLQLQTAPQARVVEEINPLIVGWIAYYNGVVPAAAMSRYDDLVEQRLLNWASKRHPGKARDWLLNRYWQRDGKGGRVFATHEGVSLRAYRQTSILGG